MDLDEFSDDGLDDLPDNALQELENHAIHLTQAQQALTQPHDPSREAQPLHSDYGWEEEDDLDTTEVTNDAGVPVSRPVLNQALRQQKQQPQLQQRGPQSARPFVPPVPNPRWDPTIDLTDGARTPLAARPRILSARPPYQPIIGSQRFPGPTQSLSHPQTSQFALPLISSQAQPEAVFSALQQRVRVLEAELNAARGEASILRSKSTKAQQEYDAQISRVKKLHAEQLAEQERAAEAALAAEKSTSTELQFLQRDMKEVSDRARRKDASAGAAAGTTTPNKISKTWSFADGFDGMDIAVSPSKGQGRNKGAGPVAANIGERTPSKGKRKRPVVDSPIKALEIHTEDVEMAEDKPASQPAQATVVVAPPAAPFDFLQLVLDHGYAQDQPPTFDILSRISFPSDAAATSFSTLIFERLPLMGNPHEPMQLLVDFVQHIINLWTRCLEVQFWEPIKYLASLISFTLQLQTSFVAPLIISGLVPVAQSTIFTLAEGPQPLPDGTVANSEHFSFLERHIDTPRILSLLHSAALACATTPKETDDGMKYSAAGFWRLISLDVMLLLLMPKQKVAVVISTLDLLATSSLPESIGPNTDDKDAVFVAQAVIERVSSKLTEHARATSTPGQRRSVRLVALRALIAFARYSFGAKQLASHENALPRLVSCLSMSIDDLYDQPIPASILPPLPDSIKSSSLKLPKSTASAELYRIISQCVLLIHTLVTDPCTANLADISRKLLLSYGGSQRYLIALGRLAFAEEDLVMEAGIEGEVAEAAHELLEMSVTVDAGEIVSEAFGA